MSSPELPETSLATSKTPEKEKPILSPLYEAFSQSLLELSSPEEKIAKGLSFMKEAISQEGSPRFKEFWEARRQVLSFFKENVNSSVRSRLWDEYVDLTAEARRLKEILDEKSAFATEQIDLAIESLEKEITNLDLSLEKAPSFKFSSAPRFMQKSMDEYGKIQSELNVLNGFAGKLSALRKEVIKTEMRIRFKTKFFKRLSEMGDQFFPKRKALIEKVSSLFLKDVKLFQSKHFKGDEVVGAPYYALRDEIKSFQAMAKDLTLNSKTFGDTRSLMSQCWDQVRVLEKEHKEGLLEKRKASEEFVLKFQSEIEALKEKAEELSLKEVDQEIERVQKEMKSIYLDREDIKQLKALMEEARMPHVLLQEKRNEELRQQELERVRIQKEKLEAIQERISSLIHEGSDHSLEDILLKQKEIESELSVLRLSKVEKALIERSLRSLKDLIADKKEQALMNLSDDDRKALESYQIVLQQKKERRSEIKALIDSHRKILGSSNLDFEKAFQVNEQLDQEKERLESIESSIEEIEEKIADL